MNPVHSTSQLTLDFEPGLADRHDSLLTKMLPDVLALIKAVSGGSA